MVLGAVACDTRTIRLGPMITALARRRPWRVALEASTLQQLSAGWALLGVGLGVPWDFSRFGEPAASRVRVAKLEEGLAFIRRLLAGDAVSHEGAHYRLEEVTFPAAEVPIWVGGWWPRRLAIHGAALADGHFPNWRDGPPLRRTGRLLKLPGAADRERLLALLSAPTVAATSAGPSLRPGRRAVRESVVSTDSTCDRRCHHRRRHDPPQARRLQSATTGKCRLQALRKTGAAGLGPATSGVISNRRPTALSDERGVTGSFASALCEEAASAPHG